MAENDVFENYNYNYIKIGFYNHSELCVRYNGSSIYENSIVGVDDESIENIEIVEPDNIFKSLVFEILYSKYAKVSLEELKVVLKHRV